MLKSRNAYSGLASWSVLVFNASCIVYVTVPYMPAGIHVRAVGKYIVHELSLCGL